MLPVTLFLQKPFGTCIMVGNPSKSGCNSGCSWYGRDELTEVITHNTEYF